MLPVEILHKLNSLKTERSKADFLRTIPEDNDFWYIALFTLSPMSLCFNRTLVLVDPPYFGDGAPPGVVKKIDNAIRTSKFTPKEEMVAMEKFSRRCTEVEWKDFYRPYFEKKLFIPLSIKEYNKVAPSEYQIANLFETPPLVPIQKVGGMFKFQYSSFANFALEPYHNTPRAYWFLSTEKCVLMTEDGRRIRHPVADNIEFESISHVVLEVYVESEEILIVRDIYETAPFLANIPPKMDLQSRYDTVEAVVSAINDKGHLGVEAIQYYLARQPQVVHTMANVIFEQGYPGFTIRQDVELANQHVVHPKKKTVLTCLDITAEHIVGCGTYNKKKVQAEVQYGLNSQQRDQYFKDRENLIGKTFTVLSCGETKGNLISPVFQQWRD